REYRVPPSCAREDPEEVQRQVLLDMYQAFALDLHAGVYLTQLTSSREHSEIHVQLMDDLMTLKMDQSNGHIVEFPLTSVSKDPREGRPRIPLDQGGHRLKGSEVYRISIDGQRTRYDDQDSDEASAHLVVVE
ncbi:unnamed protein product, partial [Prorocentrum cordatum]